MKNLKPLEHVKKRLGIREAKRQERILLTGSDIQSKKHYAFDEPSGETHLMRQKKAGQERLSLLPR